MKQRITNMTFDKISSVMTREFGSIRKGYEEDYSFILFPMEGNLLKTNRKHKTNNGRRAIEAVHICLLTVHGYLNQIEYDFSDHITDDNKNYTESLLMAFDPLTNDKILKEVKRKYDLDSPADLREYFEDPVKCLLRLEKSIDTWTKEYGVTGYFDFMEEQIGSSIKNNNNLDFVAIMRK